MNKFKFSKSNNDFFYVTLREKSYTTVNFYLVTLFHKSLKMTIKLNIYKRKIRFWAHSYPKYLHYIGTVFRTELAFPYIFLSITTIVRSTGVYYVPRWKSSKFYDADTIRQSFHYIGKENRNKNSVP